MSTVLEHALADAIALAEAAKAAGIPLEQAKRLAAELGELPAEQVTRICGSAAMQVHCGEMRRRRAR